MKVTYDKKADAAYIYMVDEGFMFRGGGGKTVLVDPEQVFGHMIAFDFSSSGVIKGIEILGASTVLPKELLDKAEIIG